MSGVLAGSTVSGIYVYMLVSLLIVNSNGAGTNINFESESTDNNDEALQHTLK